MVNNQKRRGAKGPVHLAYNSSFSACFFSRNNIFLSQQISQQCFSVGLSIQPNGAKIAGFGFFYLKSDLCIASPLN
jgi:hypothetical protein